MSTVTRAGMIAPDTDGELDGWHEVQAEAFGRWKAEEDARHRCTPSMPPCPECQERDDYECERDHAE